MAGCGVCGSYKGWGALKYFGELREGCNILKVHRVSQKRFGICAEVLLHNHAIGGHDKFPYIREGAMNIFYTFKKGP